jgi:hypothetical protein
MSENRLDRLLRDIDPVNERDLDAWEKSTAADATFERIVHPDRHVSPIQTQRRRGYSRTAVAALLAAVLVGGTAVVFALTSSPTSDPLSVGCYAHLDLDANAAIISLADLGTGITPAAACASRWEGAFGTSPPRAIVTCVVPGGGTGVFPNEEGMAPEDACRSIGAVLPAEGTLFGGLTAEQVRLLAADLEARNARVADRPECGGNVTLKAEIQASLMTFGTERWTIDDLTSPSQPWTFPDGTTGSVPVPRTADGQICSHYAIDAGTSTVILVNGWPELPSEL